MKEENAIQLVQEPIIKHQLKSIGEQVTMRLKMLGIDNMVATDETVKSLKDLRTELNKELKSFEAGRKEIKNKILNPYNEFETIYKEEISGKYEPAIEKLKNKIDSVELEIKKLKKEGVVNYFNELCQSEEIDFLTFEQTEIEINLSTSVKQYQQKCNEFVLKVADDIKLINSDEFAAEIMVEYKKTLNSSKAITDVRERKQKEAEEVARLKAIRTDKRIQKLGSLLFVYHDMTKTYNHIKDETLFISLSDVDEMGDDEFLKTFAELEQKAKSLTKTDYNKAPEPIKTPEVIKPSVEPKKEPKKETEKMFKATFEVTGSFSQLTSLKQYLIDNNLNYKRL